MDEVERSRMPEPRVTQEQLPRGSEPAPAKAGGEGILKALARKLREKSRDAERVLWAHLRDHRMAGYKFRRQFVIEPYIVDFVRLEARLIIEADGSQHLDQRGKDRVRTRYLKSLGYMYCDSGTTRY